MNEFERIARYLAPLAGPGGLALTDDAALLSIPIGRELVVTKDAMVQGVHFRVDNTAGEIAAKLLRVNLSDLAAKGAEPLGYLLGLMVPEETDTQWFADFASALMGEQQEFGISLLGGDTTRTPGPLCLSLTALGTVAAGAMLRRNSARVGDLVFVSGQLGEAALGLHLAHRGYPQQRYLYPEPRLALGQALPGLATACLDISDGLLQDAGHLAAQSAVCVTFHRDALPLSDDGWAMVAQDGANWQQVVAGGDDYELLFTAPAERHGEVMALAETTGTPLTCIGHVEAGDGVRLLDSDGRDITPAQRGWQHF